MGTPLTLVGKDAAQVADARRRLVRIGIDRPDGSALTHPATWSGPTTCAATRSGPSPTSPRPGDVTASWEHRREPAPPRGHDVVLVDDDYAGAVGSGLATD